MQTVNPYQAVRDFEQAVADYANAPHAVAVASCTDALFLCCKFIGINDVMLPKYTYPGVANAIIHAGGRINFTDEDWQKIGYYILRPYRIFDCAKYLCRDMYHKETYMCISFHGKKTIPIGRGGMILTDNDDAVKWLKCARFDGRHECSLQTDRLAFPGWNCYMTPEQASRGLTLMQWIKDKNIGEPDPYQDLSQYEFYK